MITTYGDIAASIEKEKNSRLIDRVLKITSKNKTHIDLKIYKSNI